VFRRGDGPQTLLQRGVVAENLAIFADISRLYPAMGRFHHHFFAALSVTFLLGCMHHEASVRTASLPAPSQAPVQHTGRLWIELGDSTWEHQCRVPQGQRELCFSGVRRAAFGSLRRSLWSSFPEVLLREGEYVPRGDYLLKLDVTIDASAPDQSERPGWSAVATGGFELSRDGKVLRSEKLGSRSRADFGYGGALGTAAGEVVDAFAIHVAQVLSEMPEERPLHAVPLPAVVAEVISPVPAPAPVNVPELPPASTPVAEPAPAPTATPEAPAEPAPAAGPIEAPVPLAAQ
jgi:hypothetical protein